MAYLSDWNPYDKYVQGGFRDGEFANAAFLLIAAGPPRLYNLGGVLSVAQALGQSGGDELAYPIGATQSFNLAQNAQWIEAFEIGSRRGFFIPTRNYNQLSLTRLLYHGPSLLRMLYAFYEDTEGEVTVDPIFPNIGMANVANQHDVVVPPGYENFFINLFSDLFTQPVGLLMSFRDSNLKTLGTAYMEYGVLPSHNIATDAQGALIQEAVTIQFERLVPVNAQEVELITADEAEMIDVMRNV